MPWSLPVQGAWIEIPSAIGRASRRASLPVQGAWIEMRAVVEVIFHGMSLPVQGAWIEIAEKSTGAQLSAVAPRAGSVD